MVETSPKNAKKVIEFMANGFQIDATGSFVSTLNFDKYSLFSIAEIVKITYNVFEPLVVLSSLQNSDFQSQFSIAKII